ncbi:MAG: hypothetical protein ACJ74W_24120 [Pyrinomonadaceae bacterium]
MTNLPHPYELLRRRGIYPCSSAQTVRDFIPTERQESNAWRALQTLRSRLKIDFFVYIARDETNLATFQHWLRSVKRPPDAEAVCRQLGADAPIILLAMGHRAAARTWLEQAQAQDVFDGRAAHLLALMSLAEAQHYEEEQEYERARAAWQVAMMNWVRALADDAYWDAWCTERQRCYGDQPHEFRRIGFKTAVREDLYKYMRDELVRLSDAQARAGNQACADAYAELLISYDIEWWGAQALREAGGVEVSGNARQFTCGPLLFRQLGLEQAFGRRLNELQQDQDRFDALSVSEAFLPGRQPRVSNEVVKQMRLFYSQLGRAAILLRYNRAEQALAQLATFEHANPDFISEDMVYGQLSNGVALFTRDIVELEIQASLYVAYNSITSVPANLNAARTAWDRAIVAAEKCDQRRQISKIIAEQALGRSKSLKDTTERALLERLDEAISLLEYAYPLLDSSDGEVVTAELAEALANRGSEYSVRNDHRPALDSLRRAFELAPTNLEVLKAYTAGLVDYALVLEEAGEREEVFTLLSQANELAAQGRALHQDDEDLLETHERAQLELARLQGRDPLDDAFDRLSETLDDIKREPRAASVRELINSAEANREMGSYAQAVAEIIRALAVDPGSAWARAEAVQIYVQWGYSLLALGEIEEARRKAAAGSQYSVDDYQLRKLQEEIERAAQQD